MTYATDGTCHNANAGTFNHECGKPATWVGTKINGFRSGFCDHCKEHGDERLAYITWDRIPKIGANNNDARLIRALLA